MPHVQVEIPAPGRVVGVGNASDVRHPDDVDQAAERVAKTPGRLGEHPIDIRAHTDVGDASDALDFPGDRVGKFGVAVYAEYARAGSRERVAGLASDALTGAEHNETSPLEACGIGIACYGNAFRLSHDQLLRD